MDTKIKKTKNSLKRKNNEQLKLECKINEEKRKKMAEKWRTPFHTLISTWLIMKQDSQKKYVVVCDTCKL